MVPNFKLVMRTGPNIGQAFMLDKAEMNIGRELTNEIVINDPEVSRRHARVMVQGANYILEDLGSTNGTSVNGLILAGPYLLKPGDTIVLGEQVSMGFEPVPVAADATIGQPAPRPYPQEPVIPPAQPPAQPVAVPPPSAYAPVYQQPAPVYQQPPPPAYQQPAPPAYPAYAARPPAPEYEEEPPRKKFPWLIVLLILFFLLLCLCFVVAYILPENVWCQVLGWFFNAYYGAGTCP